MTTLEDIIYDAGRSALAEQEATIAGIRQRTGTLLAAQALVASLLGSDALRADGFSGWNRPATITLVAGLVLAIVVLAPWKLSFALGAHELYARLRSEAGGDPGGAGRAALVSAAFAYQDLHWENSSREQIMRWLSVALSAVTVMQTLFWLLAVV